MIRAVAARHGVLGSRLLAAALAAIAVGGFLAAGGAAKKPAVHASSASSTTPRHGGTLTVLELNGGIGDWPAGLDPATNSLSAEDEPQNDAIFGQLFTQNPKGVPEPDLATGYKFLNGGMTVDIFLRPGVTFTDGTPFNASAVAWNIERDLNPTYACICDPFFPIASVTTQGADTVVLHMKQVYSPIIGAFSALDSPGWIASPTAYQKMGEKAFSEKPVGAGPFEVVSDVLSTKLVLKRNPNYWQKGHPYLNELIFENVGTAESGYETLQTGAAQVLQQIGTASLVKTAQKNPNLRVVETPGVGTGALQLNTRTAPFNNILAREAIYYALNPQALNKGIELGLGTVSQSGDGPASLYPILKIPGYRTYNLAKAKALVKQLGGLSFTIIGTPPGLPLEEAEQSQFKAAGMQVSIQSVPLETEVEDFFHNQWQAIPGGAGGLDPQLGAGGLAWRVQSNGPFTGIHNTYLDSLINQGTSSFSHAARLKVYQTLYEYLSKNALMPYSYAAPLFNFVSPKAHGPGLSVGMANSYLIYWPDVWLS
jgi:peptide/nickel transport system substrate-binding protein